MGNQVRERIDQSQLTEDHIRTAYNAFMTQWNRSGGYLSYEVQCIGVLLDEIDKLKQDLERSMENHARDMLRIPKRRSKAS